MRPDCLIFDMDGTLWDNVDTYVTSWNRAIEIKGLGNPVTRESILGLMGKEARLMLEVIAPNATVEEHDELFDEVTAQYQLLVPTMKPIIFEGVYEGLEKLSNKYTLMMLSNCEEGGLVNFMNNTQTTHLFADYMEHGQNLKPKSFNLKLLTDRNDISNPIYVGDTDSDSRESIKAGVPFIFVTYGFGDTENFTMKFDSFTDLTNYFMNL